LEDAILPIDVWFAIALAQIVRDVEPPLTLFPTGALSILGINKDFGE
jgi:hypothetical protein